MKYKKGDLVSLIPVIEPVGESNRGIIMKTMLTGSPKRQTFWQVYWTNGMVGWYHPDDLSFCQGNNK